MSTQKQFIIQSSFPKQRALQISPVGFIKLLNTAQLSNAIENSIEQSTHVFRNRIWTPLTTAFAFTWQQLTSNGSCGDAVSAVQLQQIQANHPPPPVQVTLQPIARLERGFPKKACGKG